jgi:hypothetical protein
MTTTTRAQRRQDIQVQMLKNRNLLGRSESNQGEQQQRSIL